MTNEEWMGYFKSLEVEKPSKDDYSKFLVSNPALDDKITFHVFDFSTLRNIYVSDNFEAVTGHSKEEGLKGLEFMQQYTLTEDFPLAQHYSRRAHELLMTFPTEKRMGARFRMSYRLLHPKKEPTLFFHQSVFQKLDDNGFPAINVGYMLNIEELAHTGASYAELCLADGTVFPLKETEKQLHLTKRELEIVALAKQGLASKNIADKLSISINTVNNIRANILSKAKAGNMAEVVAMAVKEGVI
jgi:two-component system, LuxR family, secretion system response regulator SsrB